MQNSLNTRKGESKSNLHGLLLCNISLWQEIKLSQNVSFYMLASGHVNSVWNKIAVRLIENKQEVAIMLGILRGKRKKYNAQNRHYRNDVCVFLL